jgi:hypothetical protein
LAIKFAVDEFPDSDVRLFPPVIERHDASSGFNAFAIALRIFVNIDVEIICGANNKQSIARNENQRYT